MSVYISFSFCGTTNFLFFLNFTFNNSLHPKQTVDVVEHGWLELNQGTRNMIQTSVSDLVYCIQVLQHVLFQEYMQ